MTNNSITYVPYERCSTSALSTDFTLPDYQSEIRRVLAVFPNVTAPAKYVGGDFVELSGSVDYRLVYVGMDGGVYFAPLSAPFNINIPLEGNVTSERTEVLCELCAEGASARVSAPRRLTVKTTLSACVRVLCERRTDVTIGDGAPIESIYKKSEACSCSVSESGTSDMISLSYIVPDVSDDTRVVFADAAIKIGDVLPKRGRAQCRGELSVSLLCVSEETNEYKTVVGSVPFDGEIDMEMCCEDSRVRAHGSVAELTVNITDVGIECTAGVILCGVCMSNTECECIRDVFSSQNECECERAEILSPLMLECTNVGFTVNERMSCADAAIPKDAHILLCQGRAAMDKCEVTDGKCSLLGNAVFKLIYESDNEVNAKELAFPVKYQCALQNAPEGVVSMSCCEVSDMRARISDDGVCIDCEVHISFDLSAMQKISLAESARFGAELAVPQGELAVCYAERGDTLWSVAKRYHVSPAAVIGLPENDKYVMIEY